MSPRVLFEQDLETLKNKVSEMGEHAEISYDRMLYGMRENKEDILKTLLDTDHKMVDMQRSIEAMCLSLLTRQQPVARDMRLVSAALKVVTDIERIGDHVADMVELYLRMGNMNSEGKQEKLLLEMMEEAKDMIHNSVGRFLFTYKVSLFIVVRPLFQYFIQYYINDHNEYKQHQSDGKQHLSVQSGRISHLADNGCGQESHGVKG
jgi:hypothetical protein